MEPSRTHHERVIEHLRHATRHLDATRNKVEASLQDHLEAHPVAPIDTPPESEK